MAGNFPEIRHQLIVLASRSKARVMEWTPERPSQIQLWQCPDPKTGEPFTETGAWEFIVEQLTAGLDLEEVELKKPPGRKAYVLRPCLGLPGPTAYIKLELGTGTISLRSFHA